MVQFSPAIAPIRRLAAIIVIVAVSALAGCVSSKKSADFFYQPPADAPKDLAYLKGMRIKENFFSDDDYGYPVAVDGYLVADANNHWNKPLALVPGMRFINVEYANGKLVARTDIRFEAKKDTTYQVVIVAEKLDARGERFTEFCLVDLSTGERVTPVQRSRVFGEYHPFDVDR